MNADAKYISELQQKYKQSVKPRTIKVIAQILDVDADELKLYEEELRLEISEIQGSNRVYGLKGIEIFYKILRMREVGCEIAEIEYVINKLGSDREECYQAFINSKINKNKLCRTNNKFIDQQYIQESGQPIRPISQSVAEYKEKAYTLTELLAEYKQERDWNKSLQEQNRELQDKLQELNVVATEQAKQIIESDKNLQEHLNKHKNDLQELLRKHSDELIATKREADINANTTILELQQKHQAKMQTLQEKYNEEIRQYQAKYKELLECMEQKIATTQTTNPFARPNPFKQKETD